jgi:hypothetical protein
MIRTIEHQQYFKNEPNSSPNRQNLNRSSRSITPGPGSPSSPRGAKSPSQIQSQQQPQQQLQQHQLGDSKQSREGDHSSSSLSKHR